MGVQASIQVAKGYRLIGQSQRAIATCQQLLRQIPATAKRDRGKLYELLGTVQEDVGDLEGAIASFTAALELQPEELRLHAYLGDGYSRQHNWNQAIHHYQRACAAYPRWTDLHYNAGLAYHQQGQWQRAIACYRRVIAQKSDHSQALFNLGVAYDQQGRLPLAIACYRRVIAQQPDHRDAYYSLSLALIQQRQFAEAMQVTTRALALWRDWAPLHHSLARVFQGQGQVGEAIAAYRQAIAHQPDFWLAHYHLGLLLRQRGAEGEAVACFQTVLQLNPEYLPAHRQCGQVYWRQGRIQEALEYFRRAIAQQPAWVDAYCQRFQASPGQDELDTTRATCARFLTLLRQGGNGHEAAQALAQTCAQLGYLLMESGGLRQAEAYLYRALHIQPQRLDWHHQLIDCLHRQHRWDAALTACRLALSLQPDCPTVQQQYAQVLAARDGATGDRPCAPTGAGASSPTSSNPTSLKEMGRSAIAGLRGLYATTYDWAIATGASPEHYQQVPWERSVQNDAGQPASTALPPWQSAADWQYAARTHFQAIAPDPASECGGVTCVRCMENLRQQFQPVQETRGLFQWQGHRADWPHPAPTFVATLTNGRAWVAPQVNSWRVCDAIAVFTAEGDVLGDLSRSYPWNLPGCPQNPLLRHRLLQLPQLPPVETIKGTIVLLSALSGHVYYHWMMDVLPRWGLVQRSGLSLDDIDYVVVNSQQRAFQADSLRRLGIPAQKIIESDRHPHLQADRLVVPSFPGHFDWVPAATLTYLRQVFLPGCGSAAAPCRPQRLYISRQQASYRRILNEADVLAVLQPLGFVPVVLESLSLPEQVALFAQAQAIVAPHGAGLTNLAFCQPGTQVLELTAPTYMRTDYWIVSHHLGLRHACLVGEMFDCAPIRQLMYQTPLTEDIWVNPEDLRAALVQMDLGP
ncbi:MAG: tetratricopeptide repeat protein [Synechococcales bacterium]|nr:tetratricopeptide repeat protein [Synechococcales bacterium]